MFAHVVADFGAKCRCNQRNVVERCFNRLTQFRDLATRYAKRAAYYHAELTIAAIILWMR